MSVPEELRTPVKPVAVHEIVEARVRRAIRLGRYIPGDRLPSERDLAKRLGVSRLAIREALRTLHDEGYVESRRGAAGGSVVLQAEESIQDLRDQLRRRVREFEDILDFRAAVEGATARLCAERHDAESLRHLHASLREMEASTTLPEFRRADSSFHTTIASAARNAMLEDAVERGREAMFLPMDALDFDFALRNSLRAHAAVVRAVEVGDGSRAHAAMVRHIEKTREELRLILGDQQEGHA